MAESRQSSGAGAAQAARVVCFLLDLSVLALLALVAAIALTGGGALEVGGVRVRARTVDNPIWILTLLLLLRYAVRGSCPFMVMRRWPVERLAALGTSLVAERIPARAGQLFSRPVLALSVLGCAVFLVKGLLAWRLPGFFSGDDIEVHEMTMNALFGHHWPVWELRSAFFPMTFIYPAQRLAVALGASAPETIVLAGRLVVALVSTAALPLTWMAARRLAPDDLRVAGLAVVLLAINKLQVSFGSSELPRPVSTVFVVAAFLCVLRKGSWSAAAGGGLLGVATAFRFSEIAFVPAAFLTIARGRQWTRAAILVVAAVLTASTITAVVDAMYWGHPFASVAAAIDYTLLERQSSRGYEPPWEYAAIVPAWSTFVFVGLAVAGSARQRPETWWLWTPLLILSLLPHKESRYLIPVIPFLAIAAARGLLRAAGWIHRSAGANGWRRWARDLAAPLLLLSVLHEVGGWRLVRSNEGVRLARFVRDSGSAGVAGQDLWRLGGRPYLWKHQPLVEVSSATLEDPRMAADAVRDVHWVALRSRTARTNGDPVLQSLGFRRDERWRGEDYVLYVRAIPSARHRTSAARPPGGPEPAAGDRD